MLNKRFEVEVNNLINHGASEEQKRNLLSVIREHYENNVRNPLAHGEGTEELVIELRKEADKLYELRTKLVQSMWS